MVQVLFGAMPVLGKIAITSFDPGHVAMVRMSGAAVFFLAMRRVLGVPDLPLSEQPRVLLCGILGISANQLLFLNGLSLTSANHAALITTTIPVQTILVAALLGRERLERRRVGGVVVALLGVLVLLTAHEEGGQTSLAGDLLVVANCGVYAAYLVLSRDLLTRYAPLTVLPWLFVWGTITALPFAGLPSPSGHTTASWAALVFIVLGPTIGTYWLNLFALRTVPSSVVALFIYLQPFVSVALAYPLLGERPGARFFAAVILTFSGVWLATRPREG